MKNLTKTIIISVICCISVCFTINAWGLTDQDRQLLDKIERSISTQSNRERAKHLMLTIKRSSRKYVYSAVMRADAGAIYILNVLMKKLPRLYRELFEIAK